MTGAYKNRNKFLKLVKNDFLASSRVISFFYIASAILFAVYGICTAKSRASALNFLIRFRAFVQVRLS
ncbi:MAG: hypothetical protein U0L11_01460, partial [Acutalibacteraceae bacterium]|nr:hypothetical protein [Acutalibacteraceae bacterium]